MINRETPPRTVLVVRTSGLMGLRPIERAGSIYPAPLAHLLFNLLLLGAA